MTHADAHLIARELRRLNKLLGRRARPSYKTVGWMTRAEGDAVVARLRAELAEREKPQSGSPPADTTTQV